MSVIKVEHITKDYGRNRGVFDVSFEMKQGEVLGFLGPNGAGKTTLIRHLMGFLHPDEGHVSIHGMDCFQKAEKIQETLGYLPGELALMDEMRAQEYLKFSAEMKKVKDWAYVEALCRFLELDTKGVIRKMSKGMKQKVAIARSIIHDPCVMLFDEPDSGLDFKAAKTIFDFMETCKSEGKSIIFSSHSMENIKNYSDRMVVIHKGRIVKTFVIEEYRKKYSEREINSILFNLVCGGEEDV